MRWWPDLDETLSDQVEDPEELAQSDTTPSEDLDRKHPDKERESQTDTCKSRGGLVNEADIYSRIYFGGVDPSIRREVWPYLLGHYKWNATGRDTLTYEDSFHSTFKVFLEFRPFSFSNPLVFSLVKNKIC